MWTIARAAVIASTCAFSPLPALHGQQQLSLSFEFRLGTHGGGEYGLTHVGGAAIGPEGNLFVLQPLERTVRVFTPEGIFLRYVGRAGNGPGEFQRPVSLGFIHDTLWVIDASLRRVAFFAADGEHIETVELTTGVHEWGAARLSAQAVLIGRGVLASLSVPTRSIARGELRALPIVHLDLQSRAVSALFEIDYSGTAYELQHGTGADAWSLVAAQPFAVPAALAAAPDGSWVLVAVSGAAAAREKGELRVVGIGSLGTLMLDRALRFDPVKLQPQVADSVVRATIAK
jgi:hypothetical protein